MKSPSLKQIIDSNRVGLGTVEGNIVSAAKGRETASIYVTSARPGEGKTTAAAAIAYGLSISVNEPILLAECSRLKPCFSQLFNLETNQASLVDYLLSRVTLEEVVQPSNYPNLMIIPNGSEVSDADWHQALKGNNFKEKLKELQARFSYVVFDGDAVFTSSSPTLVASAFEGIILAVECGKTKWEVVNLAKDKLVDTGAKILGVALNKREYAIPASLYIKV